MLKKELRLNCQLSRNQLSKSEISDSSLKISNNLLTLPIWNFRYYHIFLSIIEKKEVDTNYILSILQGKDKDIIIPKMSSNTELRHYLLTDSTTIAINNWNVPEPTEGIEVPVNKIDVVFIPLLAFDSLGNRVGYGKGYYDNFLKNCRKDVIKIGLSLFEAIDIIEDLGSHDQLMNYCITPDRIYQF